MEAPEKIYVHIKYKPCEITFSEVIEKECLNIEYIRTDSFIEKVCEFIEQNITGYIDVTHKGGDENITLQSEFINHFKEFMKEE